MTPSAIPLGASNPSPRTIQTPLKYWPKPSNDNVTIDFRKPGAEERFNELESIEENHAVTIRDIRSLGDGEKPTLEKNGFQYIHDPVPGYEEREHWDEKRIAKFFLPRTKELVSKLFP
jgi:hypothetical protein